MAPNPFDEQKPVDKPGPSHPGHIGKQIELQAVKIPLRANEDVTIYHFDVTIQFVKEEVTRRKSKRIASKKEQGGSGSSSNETGGAVAVQEEVSNQNGKIPENKLQLIFSEFIKQNDEIFCFHPVGFDGAKKAYSTSMLNQLDGTIIRTVELVEAEEDCSKTLYYKVSIVHVTGETTLLSDFVKDVNAGKRLTTSSMYQALEEMFNSDLSLRFEILGLNNLFSKSTENGSSSHIGNGNGVEVESDFFGSESPVTLKWKDATYLKQILEYGHFYHEVEVIEFIRKSNKELLKDLNACCTDKDCREIENLIVKPNIKMVAKHYENYDRKFTVKGVGPETSFQTFAIDGKTTTVKDYFQTKYKFTIEHPNLPCFKIGKNADQCMPMEVCSIAPNQRLKSIVHLSVPQTKEIKEESAAFSEKVDTESETMKPNGSPKKEVKADGENSKKKKDEEKKITLQGRVLPPPTVKMDQNVPVIDGKWDDREKKLHTPAAIRNWAVLNFCEIESENLDKFIADFVTQAKSYGMEIDKALSVSNVSNENPEGEMTQLLENYPNCSFILCIIEDVNNGSYHSIKTVGDRELKIVTQCVKKSNVVSYHIRLISDMLFQINGKLGGICFKANEYDIPDEGAPEINGFNCKEESEKISKFFTDQPVMIMGADMSYPAPNDTNRPSLTAVVGSCNLDASLYAVEVRNQINRPVIISDLKNITKKLLLHYKTKNEKVPHHIVMYRDAVCETQFNEVLSTELLAMRDACTELDPKYQPSITFICIQKGHKTRLNCTEEKEKTKEQEDPHNIPPGTVVDDFITRPLGADFFLCSHNSSKGISKPSHYHVLWDDADFSSDFIQLLTYSLCHTYTRCSNSVSIPTPAYYAHLAAYRAKTHLTARISSAPELKENEDPATNKEYVEFLNENCNVSADGIGHSQFYV